jgi:lipid-A-disaccharide synthase-like uncharacterized protein
MLQTVLHNVQDVAIQQWSLIGYKLGFYSAVTEIYRFLWSSKNRDSVPPVATIYINDLGYIWV